MKRESSIERRKEEGNTDIKGVVREKYGQAARRATEGRGTRCGIDPPPNWADPITSNLYDERETAELPREAVSASLGCGNPTALAALRSGTL